MKTLQEAAAICGFAVTTIHSRIDKLNIEKFYYSASRGRPVLKIKDSDVIRIASFVRHEPKSKEKKKQELISRGVDRTGINRKIGLYHRLTPYGGII